MQEILKNIPKVDKVLESKELESLRKKYKHEILVKLIQSELDKLRKDILKGKKKSIDKNILSKMLDSINKRFKPFTRSAVNGTGIVLNTGLGRAPLAERALDNLQSILQGYSTLEVNVETGKRGRREDKISDLISIITGAEAATVVNNNAAAVMICINSLAQRKEVIVSRGELVEIGGSFRMPDVIKKSGGKMVEVGSTNKTSIEDYEEAITSKTGALVKVHTSNYRIEGFTAEVTVKELSELGKKHKIPFYFDLGGGIFSDLAKYGLPHEPTVQDAIKDGADIYSFSGDKVLGGPQCGIIAGSKELIEKVKKNPLMRVMRTDKIRLALLEETLKIFVEKDPIDSGHLTLKLLSAKRNDLTKKATDLKKEIESIVPEKWKIIVEEVLDQAGSGTLPTEKLEGVAISIEQSDIGVSKLSKEMRIIDDTPVFGYISDEKYFLSVRTIFENEFTQIKQNLKKILKKYKL
ncbi:MAG: L-seryl-tRNA(Sec) selenium transferase [Candidatus Delongbacteria bacterium]|jgi:L-seryl-tRNA(Ser) seleniumtransferase|nr:L-seryl-tRNA(Sec) selenium transferase [Candidatus Delongbacteria bacterium]